MEGLDGVDMRNEKVYTNQIHISYTHIYYL